jgi:hypothetical protein
VQNKINASPRLRRLLTEMPDDEQVIEELFLTTVSRFPTPQEKAKILGYREELKPRRDQAFQDLLWALLNTKEFVFNH